MEDPVKNERNKKKRIMHTLFRSLPLLLLYPSSDSESESEDSTIPQEAACDSIFEGWKKPEEK